MSQDYLHMAKNPRVEKMIKKQGNPDEVVLFSCKLTKVNRRGKEQTRAILITDQGIYNLKPGDYGTCKRRIAIDKLDGISCGPGKGEFTMIIPDEYDYKFISVEYQQQIVDVLFKNSSKLSRKRLKITYSGDIKDVKLEKKENISIKSKKKISCNDFETLQVIGKGAFGKVLKVQKKDDKKIYAMKILKKSHIYKTQQVEHTKAERLILEAFNNPYIMNLRYAFQNKTKLYLVIDFYQGGELLKHLEKKKRFTEAEARIIVAELALALGHLHTLNFVYRDLKPENILMDVDGHICLTDFGLAKQLDPDDPTTNTFCGTPQYIAPEILLQKPHSKGVDWWSLGIVLYELVVGIPPFHSNNLNEIFQKITEDDVDIPAFVSPVCQDLIKSLLVKDPEKRIRDVDQITPHPFFKNLDWELLFQKKVPAIYKPGKNMKKHSIFASSSALLSESVGVSQLEESLDLEGFTFVSPDGNLQ